MLSLRRTSLLIVIILFISACTNTEKKSNKSKFPAINGLMSRMFPGHQDNFVFGRIPPEKGKDVFELSSKNGKVHIFGSNEVAMASGLNWYLRYYVHVRPTWDNFQVSLPKELPAVPQEVRKVGVVDHSFYLNYCTFNYTMSFWDWERWEKEIDFMALNGIDMALAITGTEAVWQHTLKRLDYTDEEIAGFLPGPAFNAWWLMGNLEGWGGPLPQSWIDEHVVLQKKILKRMSMYGIKPVMPAFYGMVPVSLREKYPDADIRDQGLWAGGFQRPAFLSPSDPLFARIANIFYEEQQKLFGKFEYYSGDPFHEGGNTRGIDVSKGGKAIFDVIQQISPEAKWVLMAWGGNPTDKLMVEIPPERTLILDFDANSFPQWEVRQGWKDRPFIWGLISNFGGNVGLFGRLDVIAEAFSKTLDNPELGNLAGLGIFPEGAENNPVIYELMLEMKWRSEKPDLEDWLNAYAFSRYGKRNTEIEKAWQILRETVYSKEMTRNHEQQGTTESIFCARPSLTIDKVSTWGTAKLYYDPRKLWPAWDIFVAQSGDFEDSASFQYDLVDVTRQVLANYGKQVHAQMREAFKKEDKQAFAKASERFLELIKDQDRLLNTMPEFMLGPWLARARAWGNTEAEKDLYEFNARTLLTTWSFQDSNLHDYAHREWGGMLEDFYLPRWKMFIEEMEKAINSGTAPKINFYAFEAAWNQRTNSFATKAKEDVMEVVTELHNKYDRLISMNEN